MERLPALLVLGFLSYNFLHSQPMFLQHKIGDDWSEGIAVIDIDRDGKLDVTSGAYWYKMPANLYSAEKWIAGPLRECRRSGEFVVNCGEFAVDVNRDGYLR